MRLTELHLKAFGPFTDQVLHLGASGQRLVLVHGFNEAGKSSTLRAIAGLRFGIPTRTADKFLHDYQQMRVGGVFTDAQGNSYSLMRRKGSGVTLKFADFQNGGIELPLPIPPAVNRLLTGGLSLEDYQSMFGLDHEILRKGGGALAKGEGEIGAALFEASSGAGDVHKILTELDTLAKKYYMPAAQAKNARINQALNDYKLQAEQYKAAQIKPSKWEAIAKASREAHDALQAVRQDLKQTESQQSLIRELIAVAPILAVLAHADQVCQALGPLPLLADNAASERASADAGLSDAIADAAIHEAAAAVQRQLIAQFELDPAIIAVAQSVSRLHAAAATVQQLRGQVATVQADISSRKLALNALAANINPTVPAETLMQHAPTATGTAQITGCMAALELAERALAQHQLAAPAQVAGPKQQLALPDANLQTALRIALAEVDRNALLLETLNRLPKDIKFAEREALKALAASGLPDEASARRVRPLLGAAVDEASQQRTALASERSEKTKRVADMQTEIRQQQDAIRELLAQGQVPTHDEVRQARAHRQTGWTLVKATYIAGTQPELESFTQGGALPEIYEHAVSKADALMDGLASDTGRVTKLEAIQRQVGALERDLLSRQTEIEAIDAAQSALDAAWAKMLTAAGIPPMPPTQLRDWQGLLVSVLNAFDALQARRDEFEQTQDVEQLLADKLLQAIMRLGISKLGDDDSLGTLRAVAEDSLQQVQKRLEDNSNAAGQAMQLQKQFENHAVTDTRLAGELVAAKALFCGHMAALMFAPAEGGAVTVAMAKARLAEFEALRAGHAGLVDAHARADSYAASLSVHRQAANSIASALSEPAPGDVTLSAESWSARLDRAQAQQARLGLAEQHLGASEQALASNQAKAARHHATLARLCTAAGVQLAAELPEAEENSMRKRLALRDADAAAKQLASASRRDIPALQQLLAGRDQGLLRDEEARLELAVASKNDAVEKARNTDEMARRELDAVAASDTAAAAADAMASAAATVRNTLPLQIRTRLAHALLQEAVRRFKERSQAPMLKSASRYFAQITGNEFVGLINDDSHDSPVIAAKRPGGALLSVEAMSEGTRDQLYLALRLAALELQRERGVDLPVILDDVLMTSDDARAGCIFKALATFSASGQVIVFTHHQHLCEVARRHVAAEALAVVELKRA